MGTLWFQLRRRSKHVVFVMLPFSLNNLLQPLFDLCDGQWAESETRTSRLDGRYDLVHIVTYYAEPNVLGILFND